MPRPRPGSFHTSPPFHLSDFARASTSHPPVGTDLDLEMMSYVNGGHAFGISQGMHHPSYRHSLPNFEHLFPLATGMSSQELEPQLLSDTPPEMSVSITPVDQDFPGFDDLMPPSETWNQGSYDRFFGMNGDSTSLEIANILDFMGSKQASYGPVEVPGLTQKAASVGSGFVGPSAVLSEPRNARPFGAMSLDGSTEPSSQSQSPEVPDAVLASQETWPFFCCNRVPKSGCSPPKTAAMYVEGLMRVLAAHDWQASLGLYREETTQIVSEVLRRENATEPIVGCSAETLNAVAHNILQRACTLHSTAQDGNSRGDICLSGTDKVDDIQLPPSNALVCFLDSYISHHKPYYACATDVVHSTTPMLQSDVPASSLLMILTIAQGAAFMSFPEARYLASGLIEACRLFLFGSIEKDILLSREPIVLQSALSFTTAAAWSGDKWHMDIAMGQRGMYISVGYHRRTAICRLPLK
jgi:hypothetical protein